jgi:hypothetical protein
VAEKRPLMQTKRSKLKRLKWWNTQAFDFLTASANWQKAEITMTYYSKFDSTIQCEESAQVTPEEYDEVMQLLADEHDAEKGSALWSASLEDGKDWLGNYSNSTEGDTYNGMDV